MRADEECVLPACPSHPSPSDTPSFPHTHQPQVIFTRRARLALATLHRPRALHALTTRMVAALLARYREWLADDGIGVIVLRGEGDKVRGKGKEAVEK